MRERTVGISHAVRRGLSLIEVLIALSISTALLVAIGFAFHASIQAIEVNDAYFQCTQNARVALGQLVIDVRRADEIWVNPSGSSIRVTRPAAELSPHEIYREFSFDAERQRITCQVFYAGEIPGPLTVFAPCVTACSFGPAGLSVDGRAKPIPLSVPLHITCSQRGASVSLNATVAPRRAQEF